MRQLILTAVFFLMAAFVPAQTYVVPGSTLSIDPFILTRIHIVNPNETEANIEVRFVDKTGNVMGSEYFSIAPFGQVSYSTASLMDVTEDLDLGPIYRFSLWFHSDQDLIGSGATVTDLRSVFPISPYFLNPSNWAQLQSAPAEFIEVE